MEYELDVRSSRYGLVKSVKLDGVRSVRLHKTDGTIADARWVELFQGAPVTAGAGGPIIGHVSNVEVVKGFVVGDLVLGNGAETER